MSINIMNNMYQSDHEHDLTSLTWLMELRNQNFNLQNITHSTSFHYKIHNNLAYRDVAKAVRRKDELRVKCRDVNGASSQSSEGTEASEKVEVVIQTDEERKIMAETNTESLFGGGYMQSQDINKSNKITTTELLSQQRKHLTKGATPNERYELFLEKVKRDLEEYQKSATAYQTNSALKPPFNYSHIIGMAILENGRATLQQICSWIEKKFAFFRGRKKWNNSIRHNLSLHQCFRKIDREKFEKGKGGYWELGVDLAKCNRKRVRNRRGIQTQPSKLKSQAQQHKINHSKLKREQVQNDSVISYDLKETETNRNCINFLHVMADDAKSNLISKTCSVTQNNCFNCAAGEHLLLDDLDIQQNIDVITCCQNPLKENDIPITDMFRDVTFAKTVITENGLNSGNSEHTSDIRHNSQQQQYQLGTIIISTTATQLLQHNSNTPGFSASTGDINFFLNGEYMIEKTKTYPQRLIREIDNKIVPGLRKRIQSHSLDNFELDTIKTIGQYLVPDYATHKITGIDNVGIAQQAANNSSCVINLSDKKGSPLSRIPNVFGDQVNQSHCLQTTLTSPLTAIDEYTHNSNLSLQCNLQPTIIDSARAYIDGIEEAFQYLRRIDNSSEDFLDHLLDISVHDY